MERIAGVLGVSSRLGCGEDHVGIVNLDDTMYGLPVVVEGGMSGRNVQAKARNHSRVASALPHSEDIAYKPPCGEIAMCPRVGRMGSIK